MDFSTPDNNWRCRETISLIWIKNIRYFQLSPCRIVLMKSVTLLPISALLESHLPQEWVWRVSILQKKPTKLIVFRFHNEISKYLWTNEATLVKYMLNELYQAPKQLQPINWQPISRQVRTKKMQHLNPVIPVPTHILLQFLWLKHAVNSNWIWI